MGTRPFPHTHIHLTPSQGLRVVPSEAQTQDEAPWPRSEGANLCVHTYTDPGLEAGALVPSGSCQVTPLPSAWQPRRQHRPARTRCQDTVPGTEPRSTVCRAERPPPPTIRLHWSRTGLRAQQQLLCYPLLLCPLQSRDRPWASCSRR